MRGVGCDSPEIRLAEKKPRRVERRKTNELSTDFGCIDGADREGVVERRGPSMKEGGKFEGENERRRQKPRRQITMAPPAGIIHQLSPTRISLGVCNEHFACANK